MDYSYFSSVFSGLVTPLISINDVEAKLEILRLSIGIIGVRIFVAGNVVTLLLYAAPILTFTRVIKNKTTVEFSCVPYIAALFNCLIYTWYGSPMVSHNWDNLPLVTINGVGVILEFFFIFIYFWFASDRGKKMVLLMMAPVIVICIAILLMTFASHDRLLRKTMVGGIGLAASIAMYGSPLVAMKQVIKTKSVEFMPFYLSFFTFLTSSLWMAYGLLSNDLLLASPNLLGCLFGLLQIVLYCMYRKKKEIVEEHCGVNLERNGEINGLTTALIVNIDDTNPL